MVWKNAPTTATTKHQNHPGRGEIATGWLTPLASFAAGVAAASAVYRWRAAAAAAAKDANISNNNNNNASRGAVPAAAENSRDSGLATTRSASFRWSVGDLTHRIGELPSLRRRGHWPWDRPRRENKQQQQQDGESNMHAEQDWKRVDGGGDGNDDDSGSGRPAVEEEAKSRLCIGSIFGLDVGGSLAKLAYFESNALLAADHSGGSGGSHAERLYRARASAQAVCMARRGDGGEAAATAGGSGLSGGSSSNGKVVLNHHFSFHGETVNTGSKEEEEDGNATAPAPPARRRRQRSKSHNSSSKLWAPLILTESSVSRSGGHHHHHHQQQRNNDNNNNPPRVRVLKHSDSSNDDLQNLASLRQESVPEDLSAFAEATGHSPDTVIFRCTSSSSSLLQRNLAPEGCNGDNRKEESGSHQGSSEKPSPMRRVRSMFDLSSTGSADHAEALDRFYNFARRLDSYREGVRDHKLSFCSHELGGEFHFIRFETRRMQNAMDLIRANKLHLNIHSMGGTGGGAHKFAAQWRSELGIEMKKQDELDSLVAGMQFVLATVVGECYTFRPVQQEHRTSAAAAAASSPSPNHSPRDTPTSNTVENDTETKEANAKPSAAPYAVSSEDQPLDPFQDYDEAPASADDPYENFGVDVDDDGDDDEEEGTPPGASAAVHAGADEWWWSRKVQRDSISYSSTYPYLVVTIGTGVSVIRVDGPRKYERVSGSTIGGGTYLGLIRLLTDVEDFDDVLRLAERGDPSKVDMLVGDIYGQNPEALEKLGLPANLVASSFGKLVAKEDPAAGLKQEDLARALLFMITTNIGQVAYLNAKLMNTPRIYFVGNFLRQNKISQRRLSYAIDYWSKGEMEGLFLEHEGYFGALGAFLLAQEIASPSAAVNGASNADSTGHRRSATMGHVS